MNRRYDRTQLISFTTNLMLAAGMEAEKAMDVANILIEGDLMGHTTHGLQMLGPYLKSMESGEMTLSGNYSVIKDTGNNIVIEGHFLPGPWLVKTAIEKAATRMQEHGVVTTAITHSHHIACLQAYLPLATSEGWMITLMSSDPSVATVAPFGGKTPLLTPNPIAVGIPTSGTPILFDFCTSITSNGQCMRSHQQGNPLPGDWIQNADGQATSDPGALFTTPPGTIYPVGGASYGHKGFALGLWVEMMTAALTGHGRSESPKKWGASVYIQLMDPAAFGGTEAFMRESDYLVHASRASEPIATDEPVRLPGEMALKRRRDQLENGIQLHPEILGSLKAWAEKWHIEMPESK